MVFSPPYLHPDCNRDKMSRTEIHSYDFFVWFIVGALLAAPGFIRCMIGRGKRRPYGDLSDA
jgi:hypothetical protein